MAQAVSVDSLARSTGIICADRRAKRWFARVLIRWRAHGDIHLLSIAAEDDVAGAMTAGRQVHELLGRALCFGVAGRIFVANDAVGPAEIQITVVKRHSEHAAEPLGISGSCL